MVTSTNLYPPVRLTGARELQHIPGDLGLPLLGISIPVAMDFNRAMWDLYNKYGEVAKVNLFFQVGVLVNGPQNVRRIQLNAEREFSNWVGYANTVAEWFGTAVLFRDFDDHRLQRRVVLSAFTAEAMRIYAQKTNDIVDHTIADWDQQQNFIALPNLRRMLIHTAAKIFYGIDDISVGASKLGEAFTSMLKGMETLVKIDFWPFKYSKGVKGKQLVRQYLRSLIPERSSGTGNDLMSFMVRASLDDEPPNLTEEELLDHLSLLFFAGYDTTTTTLLHMMMHLGMEQDKQESLREESRALGSAVVGYDDLDKLEGIHNAFQETLRLYPATPFTLRGTAMDCEMGGHLIPANTMLYIPSIVNHTLPQYWENPFKFDPSRFGKGREEHKRDNGAHYNPFGGGAHKCVGMHFAAMNAKIFMHKLLLKYRFRTPENYSPRMIKLPMPRPADNLPLSLEKLN
jgi:cytochrome P450